MKYILWKYYLHYIMHNGCLSWPIVLGCAIEYWWDMCPYTLSPMFINAVMLHQLRSPYLWVCLESPLKHTGDVRNIWLPLSGLFHVTTIATLSFILYQCAGNHHILHGTLHHQCSNIAFCSCKKSRYSIIQCMTCILSISTLTPTVLHYIYPWLIR